MEAQGDRIIRVGDTQISQQQIISEESNRTVSGKGRSNGAGAHYGSTAGTASFLIVTIGKVTRWIKQGADYLVLS